MHVVLEVTSGPDAGRKILLKADQRLTVGRTERADFAIAHDGQLSSRHFALTAAPQVCYLEDLGSTNGTTLHGTPVTARSVLRHGDMIRAGVTQFTVHIENEGAVTEVSTRPASRPAAAGVAPATAATTAVRYASASCDSGLIHGFAAAEDPSPVALADRLRAAAPLHLICDFNRFDLPLPETPAPHEFLMDWLPEASRAHYSPIVLSASDGIDLLALIDMAWGKDALIGLYSTLDQPALLRQIRPAAGAFVRPSVLAPQLMVAAAAFVNHLLEGIDAVLLDRPEPDAWNLFFSPSFNSRLESLGFVAHAA